MCKNNFNNPIFVHEYKKYRNKLTKIKTISKKAYYENMLKISEKNKTRSKSTRDHIICRISV